MALIAQARCEELGPQHFDYAFYAGKVASARFYLRNILPDLPAAREIIKHADTSAIELDEKALGVVL